MNPKIFLVTYGHAVVVIIVHSYTRGSTSSKSDTLSVAYSPNQYEFN